MDASLKKQLQLRADRMREDAMLMAYCAGGKAAHLGGGLSSIDILAVLYGAVMKYDIKNPEWDERDRFILSKGHGVLGYYSALAEAGFLTREELKTFEKDGSILLGHPFINRKKGIEFTTGSLGMGLSLGIGVSLAMRKAVALGEREKESDVYVLMGDGECNEGSVWEAFMSAAQYKLSHVTAIIDRNHFQLGGKTEDVMDIGNAADKLRAFGWDVREVDGHDIEAVYEAFTTPTTGGRPKAVIADTIKGKGFSFCENDNSWHHAVVTKDQYEAALAELHEKMGVSEVDEDGLSIRIEKNTENPIESKMPDGRQLDEIITEETANAIDIEKTEEKETNASSGNESVIKVTKSLARRWGMVGQRAAFGLAAVELAKENKKLLTLTGDVSTSAGLERMKKTFPEQFVDIGIAEQNMMGIAAGLSSEGFDVVTATFAPFQSMRCLEQIRVNLGYMEGKAVMVGLASGMVLGTLGNTHCCFEDIGVLRSIPNIAIVSPADCMEVGKALEAAVNYPKSVYIRLMAGGGCPSIYTEDYDFQIGKAVTLKAVETDAKDITTILASGTMVDVALKAAKELEETGIKTEVLNIHTIKPLDTEAIDKACEKSKLILTVEEHNIIGGLGTAVAEYLAVKPSHPVFKMMGLKDAYGHGGEYATILAENGLTVEGVVSTVGEFNERII